MSKTFTLLFFVLIGFYGFSQNECTPPEIKGFTIEGDLCSGSEVSIILDSDSGNSVRWQWFFNSCDGTPEQERNTKRFSFTLDEDVTVYVRSIGICDENVVCIEIPVFVDKTPPVITCTEDIELIAPEGSCEVTVNYDEPTATDNCGPVDIVRTSGPASGETLSIGEYTVIYEATDSDGYTSQCEFTITVKDTEAPLAVCTADVDVENDSGLCGAVVNYEVPTATDLCGEVTVSLTEGLGSGSFFPVGITTETYVFTDESGNTSTCSLTVTVRDTEPPVIVLNGKKRNSWPPNHKHFKVEIADFIEAVTDNCPGVSISDVIIESASSDEPVNGTGDGNTEDDIIIGDDCTSLMLLSERAGTGNGRVYTVNLAVVDAHGNVGRNAFNVEIEHDQGRFTETINDGPVYTVDGCSPVTGEPFTGNSQGSATGRFTTVNTYPNPFGSRLDVEFNPILSDDITAEIYDINGRLVGTLFKGYVSSRNTYQWAFDATNLKGKIYMIVIKGKVTEQTVKVLKEE